MVDGTGLENQQINVSQVRILSLPPKKTPSGLFLTSVFKSRMFSFITVLVIIIAILLRNWFPCKFSCHKIIIPDYSAFV